MSRPLEKRAVTSSLIFKFPDNDPSQPPQVALFRRSQQVRTYQDKWGPVSGNIETHDATPLACAWRELEEETTLTSRSLTLFRQGTPFSFRDEHVGREWTVHPFAFVLDPAHEDRINLDWEHVCFAWYAPDRIGRDSPRASEGVPRLRDSLRSVWFDIDLGAAAGTLLGLGLLELQGDRESGARQLASKALNLFDDVVAEIEGDARTPADAVWWAKVRLAAWHLWKNGRESMGASILNLVVAALEAIEHQRPVQQVRAATERSQADIKEAFAAFLGDNFPATGCIKIMTLSSSSTITSCLLHAMSSSHLPPLDIRVLESRPLFEGVKTARSIATSDPQGPGRGPGRVSVYADSAAALAAKDVDVVLLGADIIDKSGNVSNKTGSLPAVLAARHVSTRVKIVVLSETLKVLPFDPPPEEKGNVREMTSVWGPAPESTEPLRIHVENVSFEWVDAALIHHYVTERGVQTSADLARRAEEIRVKAEGFFGDISPRQPV